MNITIDLPVSGHLHEYRRLAAALEAMATFLERNERYDAIVRQCDQQNVSRSLRHAAEAARSASYKGTL